MHPVPLALILSLAGPLVAADRYLLPVAAGTGDGSSWANAAAVDDLEARWAALAPGDTLHLGSGTYAAKRTAIASGGEPGKPKTLVGHDTGGGLPVIAGTWTREKPAKGDDLFSFAKGVGHCVIRDLVIRAVRNAVVVPEGPVHDIAWSGLRISSVRSGFHLVGGGTPGQPDSGSTRLRIENCRMEGYTKRGLRLVGGNHQVQVVDCLADGGGKEWSVEPFPIGFMVQGDGDNSKEAGHGTPDHDITFERCEARNHYHDNGKGYWNADGFCAESRTFNLRYLACRASGNTDGGWDDKSRNPFLERCVATGNKRNFRFWTKEDGAMLKDCSCSATRTGSPRWKEPLGKRKKPPTSSALKSGCRRWRPAATGPATSSKRAASLSPGTAISTPVIFCGTNTSAISPSARNTSPPDPLAACRGTGFSTSGTPPPSANSVKRYCATITPSAPTVT